jgi:heme-degrading monooxygenase HmoA
VQAVSGSTCALQPARFNLCASTCALQAASWLHDSRPQFCYKLKSMHIILWEFAVRKEHIQEFILAYGASGDWAKLFRRAEGYLGTELLRSSLDPEIFLTIDRWESAACFEKFQERLGEQYKELDARCSEYTSSEKKVGTFTEA